jgi:hypothetical protein
LRSTFWLNASLNPRLFKASNWTTQASMSSGVAPSGSGGISSTTLSGCTSSRWPLARLSWVQLMNTSFLPTKASAPPWDKALNSSAASLAAVCESSAVVRSNNS